MKCSRQTFNNINLTTPHWMKGKFGVAQEWKRKGLKRKFCQSLSIFFSNYYFPSFENLGRNNLHSIHVRGARKSKAKMTKFSKIL